MTGSATQRLLLISGTLQTPVNHQNPPTFLPESGTSGSSCKHTPHNTLMVPGSVEFDEAVLQSISHYAESHTSPDFIKVFRDTLILLRKLFQSTDPSAQQFVVSGSGTLGWDMISASLVEKGDNSLVLNTGYFGDSFGDCLEVYGAQVTHIRAQVGERPSLQDIEKALSQKFYKLITITHVDTSTGVLSDIKNVTKLVRRVSPATLIVVDGVCSVGSEEIAFDQWGLDAVVAAGQKAIGCPSGLSILMMSSRAIQQVQSRKTPPGSYYASIAKWYPVMQKYENNEPAYFTTPPTQLIRALHASLSQITARPIAERIAIHAQASDKIKAAVTRLGLKQVATRPECQAHGLTAMYLPPGLTPPDVLPSILRRGVVFAAGLHKEIANQYIRFGHMGVSIMDTDRGDIEKALAALRDALTEARQIKGM